MGSSSKQETHSVQSNAIDPAQMAMYKANYEHAQGNAAQLTPYTGQLTAGFNPTQVQSQGILSQIGLDPSYLGNANAATAGAGGVLNSNPLTGADLQQYMDPFQSNVIDASINENERARQIAQNQINMQNTAGSAFGGSRSGVANALTNEAYDRNNQSNIANLNAANFGQAQNASLAAKNLTLNAANQYANLNNNALGVATQQGGLLSAVGDAQQAQKQRELTDAYNAYTQGQNLTIAQQNLLNQALGIIPIQQTTTSDGTTKTSSSPGIGGILGAVGGLAMAVPGIGSGLTGLLGGSRTLGAANTLQNNMPYLSNGTGGLGG